MLQAMTGRSKKMLSTMKYNFTRKYTFKTDKNQYKTETVNILLLA